MEKLFDTKEQLAKFVTEIVVLHDEAKENTAAEKTRKEQAANKVTEDDAKHTELVESLKKVTEEVESLKGETAKSNTQDKDNSNTELKEVKKTVFGGAIFRSAGISE